MQDKKILVAYFSHPGENAVVGYVDPGNTQLLGREILRVTGGNEFFINPVNPYPVDYDSTYEKAANEQKYQARPDYCDDIRVEEYDVIFLGYPIWCGDLPMVVYSFIEKHNWSGKVVIPFITHEGTGDAGTYDRLKFKMSGAILKGGGFNMTGKMARTIEGLQKLNDWLRSIDYNEAMSSANVAY